MKILFVKVNLTLLIFLSFVFSVVQAQIVQKNIEEISITSNQKQFDTKLSLDSRQMGCLYLV